MAVAWVPQVRMTSPKHCLHPDDRLRIDGPRVAGEVFATNGDVLLVELDGTPRGHEPTGMGHTPVAGTVVELSLESAAGIDGPVLRHVNSSLLSYARCHLAWLGVDRELGTPPRGGRQCEGTPADIAARFADTVAYLDGASPFWEEKAFEIEDLGVPTAAPHEWLVGRAGLPAI